MLLRQEGRELLFDGHTRVSGHEMEKDEQILPTLEKDQKLELIELSPTQHFTQPPPRFTEASLVKTLEKMGIGRPSTYAAIISTIQDRGYVKQEKRLLCNGIGDIGYRKTRRTFSKDNGCEIYFTYGR